MNLAPEEKSSPDWPDPLDSQMKFPSKAEQGIPPKELLKEILPKKLIHVIYNDRHVFVVRNYFKFYMIIKL